MKFYLYMSDTQAEVCQGIEHFSRISFPHFVQIPLERTPEIPTVVHFLSPSNKTGSEFFKSQPASPYVRRLLSYKRRSCAPSIGSESVKRIHQQTMWTLSTCSCCIRPIPTQQLQTYILHYMYVAQRKQP